MATRETTAQRPDGSGARSRPLVATLTVPSERDRAGGLRRVLTRWWLLAGVAGVAVATAPTVATMLWLDRQAEVERAVRAERTAEAELAETEAALASATSNLAEVRDTLTAERATRAARQQDRAAVEEILRATQQRLTERRATLATANADLDTKRRQLDALDECVLAVTQALNQISVKDTTGFARTLGRIDGVCARAGASL